MREAFARHCQVHVRMGKASLPVAEKTVNDDEISEAFASEWTKVSVGH